MASLVLTGDTSGQVTLAAPAVAGTTTLTLPATTGTVLNDATVGVCRAWVNFNGTGTVAIRASFNVTSITDNGTGDYTVNFTTAMSDTNYSVIGSVKELDSTAATSVVFLIGANSTMANTYATGSIRTSTQSGVTKYDSVAVNVSIFR